MAGHGVASNGEYHFIPAIYPSADALLRRSLTSTDLRVLLAGVRSTKTRSA